MEIWSKQKTRPRMNYALIENTVWKIDRKIRKKNKNRSEIAICDQKPLARKRFLFKRRFLTLE